MALKTCHNRAGTTPAAAEGCTEPVAELVLLEASEDPVAVIVVLSVLV